MELKEIKKIIDMMKDGELSEFEMQDADFKIAIKRGGGDVIQTMAAPAPAAAAPAPAAAPAAETPKADEDDGLIEITSPMVGTFYTASSPDAPPYVDVGQDVNEESVVCIVEAMKIMNEIKADVKGVIKKMLVENGTPVEYGEPLFKVEPR